MKKLILLLLIFYFGYAPVAFGAITRVQVKSSDCTGVSSCSVTFTSTTITGNTIIVAISSYYADTANSPQNFTLTDNQGNSACYTKDVNLGGTGQTQIWHCSNITGGASHQITVSAGTTAYFNLLSLEYSGIATSNSFDVGGSNQVNTPAVTYTSNNVTTTQADELLIGLHWTFKGTPAFTPDSPWTSATTVSGTYLYSEVADRIVSSTGNYADTGSVTGDTTKTTSMIATFKGVASAGTSFIGRLRLLARAILRGRLLIK